MNDILAPEPRNLTGTETLAIKPATRSRLQWRSLVLSPLFLATAVFLVALAAYVPTLAPTITWEHGGADSGDLAAAVATLGIAHPPGYPTYVLLGHLWSLLPLGGDIAYRLNLLSAVSAALAAGFAVLIVIQLNPTQIGRSGTLSPGLGAVLAGLFLAIAPLTWSQAIITEVYAPGLAAVGLLSWLVLKSRGRAPTTVLAGLVVGVSFGLLPQIVLVVPGLLLLIFLQKPESGGVRSSSWSQLWLSLWIKFGKQAAAFLGGVMMGLTVFIYLPVRAAQQPLVNWGDPSTFERFWAVVTAAQYRPYAALLTPIEWLQRFFGSLTELQLALSWGGLALAAIGGIVLWRKNRPAAIYLMSLIVLTILFRTSYPVMGNVVYLLPALFGLALLLGCGAVWLLQTVQQHVGRTGVTILGLSLLIALGVRAAVLAPQLNLSANDEAYAFGQNVLAGLQPSSVVVTDDDTATFSLWYLQALGHRPDVAVIDNRLLKFDWYRQGLESRYPDLELSSELGSSCIISRPYACHSERSEAE